MSRPATSTAVEIQETIPFERREAKRAGAKGIVMGAFYDAFGDLVLTPVEIADWSRHGVGLVCGTQVAPGSRFTLYGDRLPLPHISGTVARCVREGEKWRVGLVCEARLAA
jgi:hypothetical protein